ncbi:integrator complex subunit 8-like, partial [Amphibalanus amphitrite]|uniref:integrator complex subunit 8-like n=1 Tax=Amphibalanus amphitrite TaxID=1232801 RepID=UPI001C8FE53D
RSTAVRVLTPFTPFFSTSLFSLGSVSECLQTLLAQGIRLYPAHIPWLQGMADLRYAGHEPTSSLRHYLEACLVSSEYFSRPVPRTVLSEAVLRRMIKCCSALHCYTQAAVLCQFLDDVDYASAFQYASERSCSDAMDAYYECVWDVTLLEFLTSLHHRRAERTKRQQVIKLIGQLELNSNNNEEIQREAAAVRKARFLRAMVKQYAA